MRRLFALVIAAGVLTACGSPSTAAEEDHGTEPAAVEEVAGQDGIHRITLQPEAAARLGIEVAEVEIDADGRTMVPYSALIYDPEGAAWTYVVDDGPHVFIRQLVTVEEIVSDPDGDYVLLTDGPPAGATVASVGVAELFGTEFEVGH